MSLFDYAGTCEHVVYSSKGKDVCQREKTDLSCVLCSAALKFIYFVSWMRG